MKRKFCQITESLGISNFTRSKRPKLSSPLDFVPRRKYWVSATHIRNYMLKDPIVDWLDMHARNSSLFNRETEGGFIDFIMNRGIEFERELVKYINEKKVPIVSVSEFITDESVAKTKALMMEGFPVIHSAPLQNNGHRTRGIVDLLVRSDYLDKIIQECPLSEQEKTIKAPELNGNYHYVVIDVKFTTLPLRADGKHLLNSGNFQFYKAQTWIYTQALGKIQGYTPRYAFILGRRWNYTSRGIKYNSLDCLNKLGVIDFDGIDAEYILRTKNAIQWRREVQQFGDSWSATPPTREELYPNMCVESGKWEKSKEKIAEENKEITQIWYCGVRERNNAFKHGIYSWDNPNCNSSTLRIGPARAPIVNAILDINRQDKDKLRPLKIMSNLYNWKVEENEVFVDFETLLDIFAPLDELPKQKVTNQIFMIGVYYREHGAYKYKNFVCNKLTPDDEYWIMCNFFNFMKERGFPKMWYWHAEKSFWSQAENRQYDTHLLNSSKSYEWEKLKKWCDMATLFRTEPIVIKDCFNFGLKNIVKTMNKHGLIETKLESECNSGVVAAVKAWKAYHTYSEPVTSPVLQDIARYNEFDVRAMFDIITYLRKNHL